MQGAQHMGTGECIRRRREGRGVCSIYAGVCAIYRGGRTGEAAWDGGCRSGRSSGRVAGKGGVWLVRKAMGGRLGREAIRGKGVPEGGVDLEVNVM